MVLERCWNGAGMELEWCWNGAGAGMVLEWWWLEVADRDGSDGAGAAYTVEKGEATTERSRVQSEADSRRGRGRLPGPGGWGVSQEAREAASWRPVSIPDKARLMIRGFPGY